MKRRTYEIRDRAELNRVVNRFVTRLARRFGEQIYHFSAACGCRTVSVISVNGDPESCVGYFIGTRGPDHGKYEEVEFPEPRHHSQLPKWLARLITTKKQDPGWIRAGWIIAVKVTGNPASDIFPDKVSGLN